MAQMSDAYRDAMIKRGIENRKLREANRAFGGYKERLEAFYGKVQNEQIRSPVDRERQEGQSGETPTQADAARAEIADDRQYQPIGGRRGPKAPQKRN